MDEVKALLLECLQNDTDALDLVQSMVRALRDLDVEKAVARAKQEGDSGVEMFGGICFWFAEDAALQCLKDDTCCGPFTLHDGVKTVTLVLDVDPLDLEHSVPQEFHDSIFCYCQHHYAMVKNDYLDLVEEELSCFSAIHS